MTDTPLLALVVTRRVIGVAALAGDEFTVHQGLHLTSRKDKVEAVATRYVDRLLGQVRPTRMVLSAPHEGQGTTSRLREVVLRTAEIAGIAVEEVDRKALLAAFAASPLHSRRQVQEVVQLLWPESTQLTGKVAPYVTEAAAVALYAQVADALRVP